MLFNKSLFGSMTLLDTARKREPKSKQPSGLAIRIFADGSVFPSDELIASGDLHYRNNDKGEKLGNGIDIIDSKTWDKLQDKPRTILAYFVPKKEAKVELFSSYRSNANGVPQSQVAVQGNKSQLLLTLVKELGYMTEEQKYCDLEMLTSVSVTSPDGIMFVPKTVERGEKAGELTYVRRESITIYPLLPVEEIERIRKEDEANSKVTASAPVVESTSNN